MGQPDASRMIRRRAAAAGIAEEIGCHTFRATGITAYLANGGAPEHAQEMVAHESPRTRPQMTDQPTSTSTLTSRLLTSTSKIFKIMHDMRLAALTRGEAERNI
jgi:integrase